MNKEYRYIKSMACAMICMMLTLTASGQTFRGHFVNEELKVKLDLNLDSAAIQVPGIPDEFCYGYLQGNLNGTWVILRVVSVKENKATVRATCDNGSDAQTLELTLGKDGAISMRQVGDANIKTIEGRKYVKLPKTVVFK